MAYWLTKWFFGQTTDKKKQRSSGSKRHFDSLERREMLATDVAVQAPPAANTVEAPATPSPAAVASQSAGQSNQQFVAQVYQEFLNRAPDPAGAAYWANFLNSAGSSQVNLRQEMVATIIASPEYRQDVVTQIYEDFLNRAPDAAGLSFWSNQMASLGESAVLANILATPEYQALQGGTPQGLVNGLYTDLLGRAPDAAGQAYWLNQFGTAASGNGGSNLGLYNNGTAAFIQQMLNTHEGQLLLLNNSADSALSKLTGHGFNQLFFQGNLNQVAQNQFFADYQANPSFELALEQLLAQGGYFQSSTGSVNSGGNAGGVNAPLGSGDVPPAGYPMPTTGGANIA